MFDFGFREKLDNSKIFKILDAGHTFGAVHPALDNKIPIHLNKAIDVSINFLSK